MFFFFYCYYLLQVQHQQNRVPIDADCTRNVLRFELVVQCLSELGGGHFITFFVLLGNHHVVKDG